MAKVLSDFYFRWAQNRIQATYTADQVLTASIEYVTVDTSSNTVQITFPDTNASNVTNGKKIWIMDDGNATTNNITIISNPADNSTIDGAESSGISTDNAVAVFELVGSVWTALSDSESNFVIKGDAGLILANNTKFVLKDF